MYAVIETGGKQYRVQQGDVISVEKLKVEAGDRVTFDKVLAVNDGTELKVGTPAVDGATVSGSVVENGKGKKVIIFKYKSKKDYRKKQGHRQPYTMIRIDEFSVDGKVTKAPEAPKAAELNTEKEEAVDAKAEKVSLKSMKKAELIAFAKEHDIEIDEKAKNADMIAAIEAALK